MTAVLAVIAKKDVLFRRCLAASLLLHSSLFFLSRWQPSDLGPVREVEIDLTGPLFKGTGPAKLGAPKALVPKAVGLAQPAQSAVVPPVVVPQPQPQEWLAPTPETKKVVAQPEEVATPGGAVGGTGTAAKLGGEGRGSDYGVPGGTGDGGVDLELPRLLNLDEVRRNLRRFYPEVERRADHEGTVVVHLHIDSSGQVHVVDVKTSAGPAFDAAAQAVGKIMRFSPARSRSGPVAVLLPQKIVFRLQD